MLVLLGEVAFKFQTPRIILSGRIRVPVGWGGGWWCKVIIVSNPTRLVEVTYKI